MVFPDLLAAVEAGIGVLHGIDPFGLHVVRLHVGYLSVGQGDAAFHALAVTAAGDPVTFDIQPFFTTDAGIPMAFTVIMKRGIIFLVQ